MNIIQQARTGIILGVSTKLVNQILSWIVTIWVIRLLTPEDFSIIALNDLAIGFLLVIGKLGFQNAILKADDLQPSHLNKVFTILLLLNGVLFVSVLFLAQFISGYFNNEQLESLIYVSSLSFLLSPFLTISIALIYRKGLYSQIAKLDVGINIAQILVNLCLALLGYGFWALAFGLLIAQVIRAVGYTYIADFYGKLDFDFSAVKDLRKDSKYSFFNGLTWEIIHRVDTFFINTFAGSVALGMYRIALSLSEKPMAMVAQVVQQIGLSSFSKISHDQKLVGEYVVKATGFMALVIYPVFLGIAAVAPILVPLVLGEKWSLTIVPLQLLCVVQVINSLKDVSSTAFFAVGNVKRNFIHTLVLLLFSVLAWWIGLQYGFIEGCMVYSFSYFCWFLIHIIDVNRHMSLLGYWKNQMAPFLMSLGMIFAVFSLPVLLIGFSPIIILLTQIVIGVVVYSLIGFIFFRQYCFRVINFLINK
jgi:O-antigen/teichoic acid export membrane protein